MISCIIIDDQIEAIEIIESHLKNKTELTLIKTFTNPIEALAYVEKNKIDLIFIDVQMPHLNGLDFIESIRLKLGGATPKFILTTGYDQYALEGFEQGVIDYLMKPIGFKRFNIAIDRIINNFPKTEKKDFPKIDFFFAEVNGKKVKICFKDIAYIEAGGNYITIYCNGMKFLLYKSMSGLLEILPSSDFIRVHKSYIVSINHIEAIKGNEVYVKIELGNKTIPIGAGYRESTLSILKI